MAKGSGGTGRGGGGGSLSGRERQQINQFVADARRATAAQREIVMSRLNNMIWRASQRQARGEPGLGPGGISLAGMREAYKRIAAMD